MASQKVFLAVATMNAHGILSNAEFARVPLEKASLKEPPPCKGQSNDLAYWTFVKTVRPPPRPHSSLYLLGWPKSLLCWPVCTMALVALSCL